MENENKNNNKDKEVERVSTEETSQPLKGQLFTNEEIQNTVKSFVLSWIRGEVKIDFPLATELFERAKIEKPEISFKEASAKEVKGKIEFMNLISIIAGEKPSTPQELELAIFALFKKILGFRCGERILGTFGKKDDIEKRLTDLEEQSISMNDSIQQLIIWYRSFLERK